MTLSEMAKDQTDAHQNEHSVIDRMRLFPGGAGRC